MALFHWSEQIPSLPQWPFLCQRGSWGPRICELWVLSPHWSGDFRLFPQEGKTLGRRVGGRTALPPGPLRAKSSALLQSNPTPTMAWPPPAHIQPTRAPLKGQRCCLIKPWESPGLLRVGACRVHPWGAGLLGALGGSLARTSDPGDRDLPSLSRGSPDE